MRMIVVALAFALTACGQTVSQMVFTSIIKSQSSAPVRNNGQVSHQVVMSSSGCSVVGSFASVTIDASINGSSWFNIARTYNYNGISMAAASGAYPNIRLTATLGTNCTMSAAYFGGSVVLAPIVTGTSFIGVNTNILTDGNGNLSVANAGSPTFARITTNVTGQALAVGSDTTVDNVIVGVAGVTSTLVLKAGGVTVLTLDTTSRGVLPINFRCALAAPCTVDTTGGTPADVTILVSYVK